MDFAKEDCRTCVALAAQCDRRLPRCISCVIAGRTCGGYQPRNLDETREPSRPTTADRSGQQTNFKFVQGRPRIPRPSKARRAGQYDGFSHEFRVDPNVKKESLASEKSKTARPSPTSVRDEHVTSDQRRGSPKRQKTQEAQQALIKTNAPAGSVEPVRGPAFSQAWLLSHPPMDQMRYSDLVEKYGASLDLCEFPS